MDLSVEEKIKILELQRFSKSNDNKFKSDQTINDSKIITLNTIPDNNRIHEEDISVDFSNFAREWVYNNDLNANSISCSESGKINILTKINGGLYVSLDYGLSWILTMTPTYIHDGANSSDSTIYNDAAISSDGKFITAVSSTSIIVSNDNLDSWITTNNSLNNIISIAMSSNGKIQYVSSNDGIYISENYGINWRKLSSNNGKIKCSSSGQNVIIINTKILYSNDYGNTFKISNSESLIWTDLSCSYSGQYQTAITNDGKIYISDDYGKTWNLSYSYDDTLNSVKMSGSGKYRLIVGANLYISKDYGFSWKQHNFLNDILDENHQPIKSISLSFDGKIAFLSTNKLYISKIDMIYTKESGSVTFQPLDDSLFAKFETNQGSTTLLIDSTLSIKIGSNNVKIATSKTGKYVTLVINNGNIYTSYDFGITFIERLLGGTWVSVAMSSSGKYQTAIIKEDEIWRSDDYGQIWFRMESTSIDLNDIAISSSGKYQSICGNANVIYSSDYGYTWKSTNIGDYNLNSITMSDDGKYQTVCGTNTDNNSVMYSKTYGLLWSHSNLGNSDIDWKYISCSSCGQYQTICSSDYIKRSEDYGYNWIESNSGKKNWKICHVTPYGRIQLACNYDNGIHLQNDETSEEILDEGIYLSKDFGYTWELCYSTKDENCKSLSVSDTLQYIFVVKDNNIITSKIDNNNIIPGQITVNTKFNINNNATILLTGCNSNRYSYETNFKNSFDIISSDIEDNGNVSYLINSYGETYD